MIYSWRYPASLHRSVMIGANPPGHFLWHPQATDAQIRRYAELCADDETCHGRTDDLAALMTRTAADPPDHWWFLPIKSDHVRTASFWGLMESTSKGAPLTGPMTIDSWISAAAGDASGFWFQSLGADMLFPNAFIWGDVAAAAQADTNAARRYFSTDSRRADPILTDAGTRFLWGDGRLVDAWPANAGENQYTRVQTSKAETLLVGGELDLATPPQVATDELLPHLPNGHQVVLAELGHTQDFWSYQPEASSRMINTFFDSGTVDDTGYRPGDSRLHTEGDPDRDRQGHRLLDGRRLAAGDRLAARDVTSRAPARRVRTGGRRSAAVAVPDGAGPRWMVPRRPGRADDDA
jgi:hypothetical protein